MLTAKRAVGVRLHKNQNFIKLALYSFIRMKYNKPVLERAGGAQPHKREKN